MEVSQRTIAIVGAGASGVLTALHLLALPWTTRSRIIMFERSGKVGAGAAFSTDYESHLLNVTADSMSAFDEDPGHFVRWLHLRQLAPDGEAFVQRKLYRRYLQETLSACASYGGGPSLDLVQEEVVDIEPSNAGARVVLTRGNSVYVDAIVLASGVVRPRFPRGLVPHAALRRCISDPWAPGAFAGVDTAATVTLMGSGLSAVDTLLALQEDGHRGPVLAVSRHGLLPRVHAPRPLPTRTVVERCGEIASTNVGRLVHEVREAVTVAEGEGGDWRDVVDLLRPRGQELWLGLSKAEQLRFRRHVERFWNIHRHRMAPQVGLELDRLREGGTFNVHRGQLMAVERMGKALSLEIKLLPSGDVHRWYSDWLVNCTGPDAHVFRDDQVVLKRLQSRGLACAGPLGIGVATTLRGRVLDATGYPLGWLWAMGSLRQGQLFESTAVRELRLQAREVALQVREVLEEQCRSVALVLRKEQATKTFVPTAQVGA